MKQLSGVDAMFLYGDTPGTTFVLGGIATYDESTMAEGALTADRLRAEVRARAHRSVVFRRRLAGRTIGLAHPFWVSDPDVDPAAQVHEVQLEAPGTRAQLLELAAQIHARSIPKTAIPWEWTIVHGLNDPEAFPGATVAVINETHHAAVDGMAGFEMLTALHDTSPEPDLEDEVVEVVPPAPSDQALARAALWHNVTAPVRFAKTVRATIPVIAAARRRGRMDLMWAGPVPRTRFNAMLGPDRVHESIVIPLAELKGLRALVAGATINDLMLAVVAGGLRSFLIRHGELPTRSLVAAVPVALRMAEGSGAAGNMAVFSALPFGTDIADPLERLAMIHKEATAKKEIAHSIPADVLNGYADLMPGSVTKAVAGVATKLGMADRMPRLGNVAVTNVPVWPDQRYLCGAALTHYEALAPVWHAMGLVHVVTSYNGQLALSIDADAAMLPNVEEYRADLVAAYGELVALRA